MENFNIVLEAAEELNDIRESGECESIFQRMAERIDMDNINGLVMLFAMCINKKMGFMMDNCQEQRDEAYPPILNSMIKDLKQSFCPVIEKVAEGKFFCHGTLLTDYLNLTMERLLSGVKYQEPGREWNAPCETNEWNTRFRREERVRDSMKRFITSNDRFGSFTRQHKIEIPYLYAFAWDICNFGREKRQYYERNRPVEQGETDYSKLLPNNLKTYLGGLSNTTLAILFDGELTDENKFEESEPNSAVQFIKTVSFRALLPTLEESDHAGSFSDNDLVDPMGAVKASRTHQVPVIKKEVLKAMPLLPMSVKRRQMGVWNLELIADVLRDEAMLEEALEEVREISRSKSAMVSDFTHRYKNLSADNLYNIAQALLMNPGNDEDLKDKGRELLIEYENKQMLAKEVVMLNLEHTDRFEELKAMIGKSVCSAGEGLSMRQLVNEAAKRVLLRTLLVADDSRIEEIRDRYERDGIDTWRLLELYETDILKGNADVIEWMDEHMGGFAFACEDGWNRICLKNNTEGSVFLSSLVMELLLNMFTYCETGKEKKLIFREKDGFLEIETVNQVDLEVNSYTRKGISSRNRILSKLNYGKEYKLHDSIATGYEKETNRYTVTAKIRGSILQTADIDYFESNTIL